MHFPWFRKLDNTLALQLFQVMRLSSAVLTGVLLAKSGLPTSEIGAWEMLLYLGTTFTFFWVNGLLQGITPVFSRLEAEDRKVFIFNNFLVFSGLSVLLFLLLISGESWLAPALTGMPETPHFKCFALYLLLNLPSFPIEYYYLLHQRPRAILGWGVFAYGLHLPALVLPIWLGYGLEGGVVALVVLAALKCCWAILLVSKYGKVALDRAMITRYLVFCAPLMLTSVVSNLMLLFDNWLVGTHYQDPEIFAIYRYGAREFPLATALVTALGASLVPMLTETPAAGLASLKAKSTRLMHFLFPVTALLMLSSSWLFPRVFNADFQESAALFNIYLLTLASRILLPASIVLSKGDTRSIFTVSLVEMAVKLLLGFWFIRWWGLEGLAWSVVLAFWVEKIGLMLVLDYKFKVRLRDWLDWRWYLIYTGGLIGAFLFSASRFYQ